MKAVQKSTLLLLGFSIVSLVGCSNKDSPVGSNGAPLDQISQPSDPNSCETSRTLETKTVTMYAPFVDWSLKGCDSSENPFDVIAKTTFIHQSTGETKTSELFFTGNDRWQIRFTGVRTGLWTFTTESPLPSLHNHTGSVKVDTNPDVSSTGFMRSFGNKFAVQSGPNGDLQAFRFNVFQYGDNDRHHRSVVHIDQFTSDTENKAKSYARAANENGMSAVFIGVFNSWLELGTVSYDQHSSENPDLETFDILEKFIIAAHSEGVRVHFWVWGDEQRKWSATGLPGGINGSVDKRLQRYIAARLGPIPGWSFDYGFDLNEWTTVDIREEWLSYMHSHLGWDHLLGTRAFAHTGANTMRSYSSAEHPGDQLSTIDDGPGSFSEVLSHISSSLDQVTFYGERHWYNRPGFGLNMDGTRRLIWWQTMAGGVGGWYGFEDRDPVFKKNGGYPNPEQLRTISQFFQNRFFLDSQPCGNSPSGALCLRSDENKSQVYYGENVSNVSFNVPDSFGPSRVIAIDTKKAYQEILVSPSTTANGTFNAPNNSDWAISIEAIN